MADAAALVEQLNSRYLSDREHAAEELSKLDRSELKKIVPDLLVHIEKGNWLAQCSAARVLQASGDEGKEAVPRLHAVARAGLGKQRRALVALMLETMGKIDPGSGAALVPELAGSLKNDDPLAVVWACEMLVKVGPEAVQALPALAELLNGEHDRLSRSAAEALRSMGPAAAAAVPDLANVLRTRERALGQDAARALAAMGSAAEKAIPALSKALGSGDGAVAQEAGNALVAIGVGSVPTLIERVAKGDASVSHRAATLLGRIGPGAKGAVPALQKALQSDDGKLINAAAAAVIKIDSSTEGEAIAAVAKAVRSADEGAARDAIAMLQRSAPKIKSASVRGNAVQALVSVLENGSLDMKRRATYCLGSFGPDAEEAVPMLQEAAMGVDMKEAAVAALKKIAPGTPIRTKPKVGGPLEDDDLGLDL